MGSEHTQYELTRASERASESAIHYTLSHRAGRILRTSREREYGARLTRISRQRHLEWRYHCDLFHNLSHCANKVASLRVYFIEDVQLERIQEAAGSATVLVEEGLSRWIKGRL